MAQTIGDFLSRYAQQAVDQATAGTPIRRVSAQRQAGPTQVSAPAPAPTQAPAITPVASDDRGNWFERQASAPWIDQTAGVAKSVGNAAEEGGSWLKKVGKGIWDTVGPDTEAWGDIFSGDATLGDWASAGLDVVTLVPGVGVAGRAAGKVALKGAVKAAGKEGLGHAAKNAAKGSAIRNPATQKSLGEMLEGGLKSTKAAGPKEPGIIRRQFTDPNLAASKSRKSAGAAKKTAPKSTASDLAATGAPTLLQRGAGNVSSKMLNVQRLGALENRGKTFNKMVGRNKARLGLTSTSKTSNALKLGAMGTRNTIQDLLAARNGSGGDTYAVDFGGPEGPQQMPGDAMIGYYVPGGGGGGRGGRGGGSMQTMSVADAAAAYAAGSLQSGGTWVRLS